MKNPVQFGILLLVLAGFCLPASAIVVDDYSVAITNPPAGPWDVDWDNVYYYEDMSAVAVGSHWLLTAAHAAMEVRGSDVDVNGTTYYEQEVILHDPADDPEHSDIADLALVRFDKPFPGYYPLYTGSVNNKPVVLVGYGNTGTVYSTYYTLSSSGSGVKRWGSNKIDGTYTLFQTIRDWRSGGTFIDTDTDGLLMFFNLGNTTYEGSAAVYDSGGGTFVKDGSTWKLAGIITAILQNDPGGPNITFSASVPEYHTWITQMIAQAEGDADSDGLPNWWEEQYGSTTGVVASADQDGDGMTGTEEYTANTDPTDSNAVWQASGSFTLTNQAFTFDGSTARKYQVLYTTNDLEDPGLMWISNGVPVWGEGAGTEITVTNTEDTVFYRVWVTLP